ncbi:M20 family metallopeptidase [Aspergillus lucknowensis]|uniref:Peptidase M20 domain-containing protein 2 n=1 Tax=Aspergillus lucknowensis TaxID=176173 RepID=A0ABR4M464_9EURO
MHLPASQVRFIKKVQDTLREYNDELQAINHKIWSNPELGYEEHKAHDNICDLFDRLKPAGYTVRRHAYGLDTAFEIEYKHDDDASNSRVLTFNAEIDALPGIGHACGHNLIATSSIAAFIATCEALKAVASDGLTYTVRLLGTPAEESGGGKIRLLDNGAYKDVDACLMLHPMPILPGKPELLSLATAPAGGFLANDKVTVTFTGKPAHAAAAPWEGINALDAVVAAYVNISLLRQQIQPSQRVHGIIVNGGSRPNIIPGSASVEYFIRSPTVASLKPLTEKVVKCFEAAATATGCKVDFEWGLSYADVKSNTPICESYVSAMRAMDHHVLFTAPPGENGSASTDMGNVSYAVPGFHGIFTIPAKGGNHTPHFADGAGTREAYTRAIDCAAGMAVVACHFLEDDGFATRVWEDFEARSSAVMLSDLPGPGAEY